MHRYNPIGVLDSGVGGLTVVREIQRLLPHERIVYFGDTARMPYGPRPHEEVRRFALEIIDFLQTQEVKLVVVACNSAAAAGLSYYQEHCTVPVVEVIQPGARAALAYTRNGRVGVIGTAGTIASSAYTRALHRLNPAVHVVGKACPLFVLLVENELVDTPEAEKVAREYLSVFQDENIDTLILGCTHYPLMSDLIQRVMGPGVKLVSSAEETAAEVRRILTSREMLNPLQDCEPSHSFFVSGRPSLFQEIGSRMLQRPLKAYQVIING